jgi:uncharacterized protein
MSERSRGVSRRRFLATSAAIAGAAAYVRPSFAADPPSEADVAKCVAAMPDSPTVPPKKERRILIIDKCQGFYHGVIPLASEAMIQLGTKTGAYTAERTDDLAVLTADNLANYDALLFNNTTRLNPTDESKAAILDFMAEGKGVIGVHAAADNFYDWPEGAAMIGGLFAGHPWGGGGTWAVKLDEPKHALCKAFDNEGFLVKDEIYQMKNPYSRESLRVLVSLDMDEGRNVPGREDGDNAISWIQPYNGGRVFYCSLGHNNHIFWSPAILQHYCDGIQYALGEMQCDDRPSAELDAVPTPALCPKEDATAYVE